MTEPPAPFAHGLPEDLRVETRGHAEREGLGGGGVVDRDQQVGDQLHGGAVAEGADVAHRAREGLQHRAHLLERLGVTAAEHHEVAVAGLRTRAAQRAVEQHDTGLGQHLPALALDGRGQRRGLHDDRPAEATEASPRATSSAAEDDGSEVMTTPASRPSAPRSSAARPPRPTSDSCAPAHRVDPDDVEAGGYQVARHRRAHDPQADDADGRAGCDDVRGSTQSPSFRSLAAVPPRIATRCSSLSDVTPSIWASGS